MKFISLIAEEKEKSTRESVEYPSSNYLYERHRYSEYEGEFLENYSELMCNHIALHLRLMGDAPLLIKDILKDMSTFANKPPRPIYNKDTNKQLSDYELELIASNYLMGEGIPLMDTSKNPQGWCIDTDSLRNKLWMLTDEDDEDEDDE